MMSTKQEATNMNMNVPDEIINAYYSTYTERINTIVDWLETNSLPDVQYQWIMVKQSISYLTEDDYNYIRSYKTEEGKGFMWADDPTINAIQNRICQGYDGHSGYSMAWTMRYIQYIVSMET